MSCHFERLKQKQLSALRYNLAFFNTGNIEENIEYQYTSVY